MFMMTQWCPDELCSVSSLQEYVLMLQKGYRGQCTLCKGFDELLKSVRDVCVIHTELCRLLKRVIMET